MTVTVPARPFNNLVKAAKQVIQPNNAVWPAARQLHLHVVQGQDQIYYLKGSASDGMRVSEDTIACQVLDPEGPDMTSVSLPRLAAKSDVTIEMLDDKTVISFDDVAFTAKPDPQTTPEKSLATIGKFSDTCKTDINRKPGRTGIHVNPRFLLGALESMQECEQIWLDVGSPVDPVLLHGVTFPCDYDHVNRKTNLFRLVLPVRHGVPDQEYRENLAGQVQAGQPEPEDPIPEDETRKEILTKGV